MRRRPGSDGEAEGPARHRPRPTLGRALFASAIVGLLLCSGTEVIAAHARGSAIAPAPVTRPVARSSVAPALGALGFSHCTVAAPGATFLTFDAADGQSYAADGSSVVAIRGACASLHYIPLPANSTADGLAYDPLDSTVYVTDPFHGAVYLLQGHKVLHTLRHLPGADRIVYDPAAGGVAVAHTSATSSSRAMLSLIVGTRVTLTVRLAFVPWTLVYASNGSVLGAAGTLHYRGTVEVLNASTLVRTSTVGIGSPPSLGVAYDPGDGLTYFGEFAAVSVVNLASGAVVTILHWPSALGYANAVYNPARGVIQVVFWWTPDVYTLHGFKFGHFVSAKAAKGLYLAIYDPQLARLMVSTGGWGSVYVLP